MYKSYYHRPPRRTIFSYILPFLIIASIITIFILAYNFWRNQKELIMPKQAQAAYLSIEQGAVEVLLKGTEQWRRAPDQIKLFQGDSVRTNPGSRAQLLFFDQSILRLDSKTKIVLNQMKEKNGQRAIAIVLHGGKLWANIHKLRIASTFKFRTDYIDLEALAGTIEVEENSVRVLDGESEAYVLDATEKIKKINIGVGQEITVTDEIIKKIKQGNSPKLLKAVSEAFKESPFYIWNQKKDGKIAEYEGKEEKSEETVLKDKALVRLSGIKLKIQTPQEDDVFNTDEIKVSGQVIEGDVSMIYVNSLPAYIKDNLFSLKKVPLVSEGTNLMEITYKDKKGKEKKLKTIRVIKDTLPPPSPKIIKPETDKNGEKEITELVQVIEGTVSKDTYRVVVNDYTLQKYLPGNTDWAYIASAKFGNLQIGKNEYEVVAVDEAGNKSKPEAIILVLTGATLEDLQQKGSGSGEGIVYDKNDDKTGTGSSKVMIIETSGKLTVDSPLARNRTYFTGEKTIKIKGNAPAGTEYIKVNDYKLNAYKPNDEKWIYAASRDFGNLKAGENIYEIKSFDANGAETDRISVKIYLETSLSIPKITIPTEEEVYTTTLDVIKLAGETSSLTKIIYINNNSLKTYVPFARQWNKTVNLKIGNNRFRVVAEDKNGNKTRDAVINIVRN